MKEKNRKRSTLLILQKKMKSVYPIIQFFKNKMIPNDFQNTLMLLKF